MAENEEHKIDTIHLQTKETWQKFAEESQIFEAGTYVYVNEEYIQVLEHMLTNARSCEQLQSDLAALVADRKDFVKYATAHLP